MLLSLSRNTVNARYPSCPSPISCLPLCTKPSIRPACISPIFADTIPQHPHNPHLRALSRSRICTLSPSLLPAPSNHQYHPPQKQNKRTVLTSAPLSLTLLGHIPLRPLRLRLLYQLALMIVFGIYLMNLGFRREHGLPVYAVEDSGTQSGPAEDLDEMGLLAREGRER